MQQLVLLQFRLLKIIGCARKQFGLNHRKYIWTAHRLTKYFKTRNDWKKSWIPNPESQILNSKSQILNPKSSIPNSESQIPWFGTVWNADGEVLVRWLDCLHKLKFKIWFRFEEWKSENSNRMRRQLQRRFVCDNKATQAGTGIRFGFWLRRLYALWFCIGK